MKTTALHPIHVAQGAKMVDFAGYHMPMVYSSVKEEHLWVRKEVGLFDVSHMGLFKISGEQAGQSLQEIFSNDVNKLSIGKAQYTLLLSAKGGIVDDLLLYRITANEYLAVVNAANVTKDWGHIMANIKTEALWENLSDDWSILALQGPRSQEVMHHILNESTSSLTSLNDCCPVTFSNGATGFVARTGYTGEVGYEIIVPHEASNGLWEILEQGKHNLKLIGLGARDTLRTEMGFCLHGQDIDETKSPKEAGLMWAVHAQGDFLGKAALDKHTAGKKRLGFVLDSNRIARPGQAILHPNSLEAIGVITSGCPSFSTEKSIAIGYVNADLVKSIDDVLIDIRGKYIAAERSKMPFYKLSAQHA
ncbi:MAG TPA: glycine cleavage system aminomethyltransferase GcvT [Bacteroidetes bacterium]|nr:glycine cleavage system aminomethyltransferase GcvT [Bacteroidota bacterium]